MYSYKAQQHLHFLRILRWNRLQTDLLVSYWATIESVLVHAIAMWYAGWTTADKKRLQNVTRIAEKVIGCPLPSLECIASSGCRSRAWAILTDHFHPNHHLFNIMPSGERFRSIRCNTNRLKISFFPWADRSLNAPEHWHHTDTLLQSSPLFTYGNLECVYVCMGGWVCVDVGMHVQADLSHTVILFLLLTISCAISW